MAHHRWVMSELAPIYYTAGKPEQIIVWCNEHNAYYLYPEHVSKEF